MYIFLTEVRDIIKEVWNKLYFDANGEYRNGVDDMRAGMEQELKNFEDLQSEKMAKELDK